MLERKILNSTRLVLFIISGLIILIAVFLVGLYWGQMGLRDLYQEGYETAWQKAKSVVQDTGVFAPEPEEIYTIRGTVLSKKTNEITLSADTETDNPFVSQGPLVRNVKIDESTQILKRIIKTDEEFEREIAEYIQKTAQAGDEEEVMDPPTDYTEQAIDFDDIVEGDTISVTALENIKGVEEFTASAIHVLTAGEE